VLPKDSPTPAQRLEMLQIATAGLDKMEVSDLELNREGTSYTYQTVQQVRRMYPRAKIYLLMGTDMFLSFHSWKNPQRILDCVTLAVMYRGEKGEAEKIAQRKAENIELIMRRIKKI
jgi:nicotinate-nucleotide adenylyltransferase